MGGLEPREIWVVLERRSSGTKPFKLRSDPRRGGRSIADRIGTDGWQVGLPVQSREGAIIPDKPERTRIRTRFEP